MRIGIIDVGGGMRGIYGAGIMDRFMEEGITFDYSIGVSAGSANLSSYLSRQTKRNYKYYAEYAFRWQYMSFRSWIVTGNYLNLEYIYGSPLTNSDGECPLDFKSLMDNPMEFEIVATDSATGKPVYFSKNDMKQDDYGAVKGSSCVPVAAKPYQWNGYSLFDGGLSDPIPLQRAFDAGCDKVLVILTRPKDYFRISKSDKNLAKLIKRKYPVISQALIDRSEFYNSQLRYALEKEKEGSVFILAPESVEGMKTLTKNHKAMNRLYNRGYEDAKKYIDNLSSFTAEN